MVTLRSAGAERTERRLLDPFDLIQPIRFPAHPRIVGAPRWRMACRHAISADGPPGSLRRTAAANIQLMPHQLEPAIAVMTGLGTRVLLADDVGLGKTIQAGLIVSELCTRGWSDRVLVLAPAGLREQWRSELKERFAIEAVTVDARALRRLASTLPIGVNPWSTVSVAIASTDYVKRAEVLSSVLACPWDIVIVDEAHGVEGDSDRRSAVHALATKASYVLLLTATPHNGDARAFAALCGIGGLGEAPLIVFRRRRNEIRSEAPRRLHTLAVRPGAAERNMHVVLARYCAAVRAEHGSSWLALSVLHKRAFSGAWALHQSIARRLAALTTTAEDVRQLILPLGDPHGELTPADEAPAWPTDLGLSDPAHERDLLQELAEAARVAARDERKIRVLRRLLRRVQEHAIVFTEYRDTLLHVHRVLADFPTVVLHGGMTREEREAALNRFARGANAILLATDAAGEGLNLHHACRLVINLELPWNPMRLEQRIGRVDRIGQSRAVHAFHLVGDGTGEARILDRLRRRISRARADIDAADPLGMEPCDDERDIARLVVEGDVCRESSVAKSLDALPRLLAPDCRATARAETERLRRARAVMCRTEGTSSTWSQDEGPPWITSARRRALRIALESDALLIWQVARENPVGVVLESHLVALRVSGVPRLRTHRGMRHIAMAIHDQLGHHVETLSAPWHDASTLTLQQFMECRAERERSILADVRGAAADGFQPGLFDRRADRSKQAVERSAADMEQRIAGRLARVEHWGDLRTRAPRLILVAFP